MMNRTNSSHFFQGVQKIIIIYCENWGLGSKGWNQTIIIDSKFDFLQDYLGYDLLPIQG